MNKALLAAMILALILLAGCGGEAINPKVNAATMGLTPEEFYRRFNEQMSDANLKLDKPEITWGADQKIKGDVNYYPAGFYKTPAADVHLKASCQPDKSEIQSIEVWAQVTGEDDLALKSATSMYRVTLKAVNPEISDSAIDEILAELGVNEPLASSGQDRTAETQRHFANSNITWNYNMADFRVAFGGGWGNDILLGVSVFEDVTQQ